MIIDVHAHVFPDKLAEKASVNIGHFYGLNMKYNGTVESLLKEGTAAGVDKFVIHSVATSPKQVDSINHFIHDTYMNNKDIFIGFCSLHPDSEKLEEEFDWAMENGLKGIKLHPDFQKFYIDDDKAMRIYELAEGVCPIIMHMGDYRTEYSKSDRLVKVLDKFPNLDVIAAHFGGFSEWDTAAATLSLAKSRVYVDTSSSTFRLAPNQIRELIDIYGADRVLFGTDYPMWGAQGELDYFKNVEITDDEWDMISHKNFENLMLKYEK